MKKSRIFVTVLIFCLFLMQGLSFITIGDAQKPEWKVGDKWVYEYSAMGLTVTYTYEVNDILTINVNNTSYEVYDVMATSELYEFATHGYYSTNDLAMVKAEGIVTNMTGSYIYVHTFHPPKKEFNFPLSVGKTWTTTYIDSEYDDEYDQYSNMTRTENYTVEKKESVKVKAGTFECYRIKSENKYGTVGYSWYSPKAKFYVKISNELTGSPALELASTTVKTGEDGGGFNLFAMPYLLLLIIIPLIIVVSVVVLLIRRRGKATEEVVPEVVEPSDVVTPTMPSEAPFAQPYTHPQGPPFQCPNCGRVFIVASTRRPLDINCPYCGIQGTVK